MPTHKLGTTLLEYTLAPHMVVFSHGFGVQKDSRGLFSDIVKHLPAGFGYVLFDYNDVDESHHTVAITDFADQVERLNQVLTWTLEHANIVSVDIIGHSMGCITTALAKPEGLRHVVLLAPPMSVGERTRAYFTTKKGAEKQENTWIVPRSDGTISLIPETFFDQYEEVDALKALRQFAEHQPFTLVCAGADEVLTDTDYTPLATRDHVHYEVIEGANHNFNNVRSIVTELIVKILTS